MDMAQGYHSQIRQIFNFERLQRSSYVTGGVGFLHLGEGFRGSGTGPTYQIGLGLDIPWF
jgi:hypothetical protein